MVTTWHSDLAAIDFNRETGIKIFFADATLIQNNRVSGAATGISARGQGNKFFGNDLSFASALPISIVQDNQFEIAGNDFSHSANGLNLHNIDGLVASPNPGPGQISIDVSTIPGVGLFLSSIRNSHVSGLTLSWNGANVAGWSIAPGWNKGVFVQDSPHTTMSSIVVKQREFGISLASQDVLVECSSIQNNGVGIRVEHPDPQGLIISGCDISGNPRPVC